MCVCGREREREVEGQEGEKAKTSRFFHGVTVNDASQRVER